MMNRHIESIQSATSNSLELHLRDAGISGVSLSMALHASVPRSIATYADSRLEYDSTKGWPPKLRESEKSQCIIPTSAGPRFDLAAQRRVLQAALCHPDVYALLSGRWETLGVHLTANRDMPCEAFSQGRVCLYNYTSNRLIEVFVAREQVTQVRLGDAYQHPEAPIEMSQAVALARAHPKLKEQVASLDAHAILHVPAEPSGPNYNHRCLLVMFTERNDVYREIPALFSALVDLCEQRVLAYGACSCSDEVGHGSHLKSA